MTKQAMNQEALSRAVGRNSTMNYAAIFDGFAAKGIPMDQVSPRENVFTYNAWLALGRQVRKGEHGVKVVTFVPMDVKRKDAKPGEPEKKTVRRAKTTTVFHISQTDPVAAEVAA